MLSLLSLRISCLHIFLLLALYAQAQDRVYLKDGTCHLVKVLEIAPDNITVSPISESGALFINADETIPKKDVVLIEYKNGTVEIYNIPEKTAVYAPNGSLRRDPKKDARELAFKFVSLNTLALCNADVSVFFEHLVASKKIGLGGMAAYNFNRNSNLLNLWLSALNNAKKNYDLGAFVNFYPAHFTRRTTFYFGAMFKYTSFSFSKVVEENNGTSVNLRYFPAKGSQMATIINIGTHSDLRNNLFFKTIIGFGGFNLRGDYRQQFNYFFNQNATASSPPVNFRFLPKLYFGLNMGFSF